jgi:hypothetical protein
MRKHSPSALSPWILAMLPTYNPPTAARDRLSVAVAAIEPA